MDTRITLGKNRFYGLCSSTLHTLSSDETEAHLALKTLDQMGHLAVHRLLLEIALI